jgi:YidC/Oxa1 family membrane protein insertase
MLPAANIFQPLIDVANSILQFFHDDVGVGWGISIILLTIVTRIIILPLSIKQIRSIRSLQAHQPDIKAIQEKYKDDRQRLQRELMSFYQENQINPFASCVPLLLQLPVFMALFYLLRSDEFKNEIRAPGSDPSFLGIPYLDEKATGAALIILVVLYFVTMVGSTSIMATSAEGSQRVMMYALPVVFTPFVIAFPAGLVVYWITTNVWTMGQQWVVKQVMPPPQHEEPAEGKPKPATKAPPPPPRKKKRRRR